MFGTSFGKTALRALVASSVAGLIVSAAPAGATVTCDSAQRQRTLALKVGSADTDLSIGDKATFSVKVVRQVKSALGGGISGKSSVSTETPAEGARVAITLSNDDTALHGVGITDADGRTQVSFKVTRFMKVGLADLDAYASIQYGGPCHLGAEEWGSISKSNYANISG